MALSFYSVTSAYGAFSSINYPDLILCRVANEAYSALIVPSGRGKLNDITCE